MYARNQRLEECYRTGLADEEKVINFLRSKGYSVIVSTESQDYHQDIDCYVNGKSVSIKSQHKGVYFRNIGLELANMLTSQANCKVTEEILEKTEISLKDVHTLVEKRSWEPGWFTTGSADNYLFYQGDKIRLYTKESISKYVLTKGFFRIRPLSSETKSYLGGSYRHCNTICGYLRWSDLPHGIWQI